MRVPLLLPPVVASLLIPAPAGAQTNAGPDAPFSWRPEVVQVLDSGTLALTSGPVRDPTGRRTGTFNSIWRREPNDQWRVVFDKGCPPPCDCQPAK